MERRPQQVAPCARKFRAQRRVHIRNRLRAQKPVSGPQGGDADGNISERVAKKRGHQRRNHIAAHQPRQKKCDEKVHGIKRLT